MLETHPELEGVASSHLKIWRETHPNLRTIDERGLAYVVNVPVDVLPEDNSSAEGRVYGYLAEKGVVEYPEVTPVDDAGREVNSSIAVYTDTRISSKRVTDLLFHWLPNHAPNVWAAMRQVPDSVQPTPEEVTSALDKGMDSLGITDVLRQIEHDDTNWRQETAGHIELDQLMRNMRGQMK